MPFAAPIAAPAVARAATLAGLLILAAPPLRAVPLPARAEPVLQIQGIDATAPPRDASRVDAPQRSELRARLWWGAGPFSLGSGADLVSAGSSTVGLRPVVGIRAQLSPTARLSYELLGDGTPAAMAQGLADARAGSARGSRWALEVKSAENTAQQLRSGLFRFQLSSTSTLSLRPRSGGLSVTWRARF